MCYTALQQKWLAWSEGYPVPIERTTLRGVKVYAPIAGKDLTGPAKQRDAIWHYFFKTRGKAAVPKFRADQIQLAVVIDYDDFQSAELRKERQNGAGTNTFTSKVSEYCGLHCISPLVHLSNRLQ